MKDVDISKYNIGVFVGRLQIHDLHEGHHYVLQQVVKNHKKTIIFLGVPRFIGTRKNPLDFDTRKKMIQTYYPDSVILAMPDQSENLRWTSILDRRIREIYPHGEVLMYGSRDSFIPAYIDGRGKFQTKELEPLGTFTATDIRKLISDDVKNSIDFRSGVIYHALNLEKKVTPTVTVIPMKNDEILLAKKYDESKFRFMDGFITVDDLNVMDAAKRVFFKETTMAQSGEYKYIGTSQVKDWRFRGEDDRTMTTIFTCKYLWGAITPTDDVIELKWFNIDELKPEIFMEEHKILFEIFKNQ